jgi:DNA-binding transcriptional ArsR family regulator
MSTLRRFPLDSKASLGFDSRHYLSNRNLSMSKRNTPLRRHTILALLAEQGEVSVDELSKVFATSEVTIRKDLAALEKSGLLLRRYGGAGPMPQPRRSDTPPSSQTTRLLPALGWRVFANMRGSLSTAAPPPQR